ncbi:MAG TPA: hypothetical protein VGG77_02865 [Roseiarcus sp.]
MKSTYPRGPAGAATRGTLAGQPPDEARGHLEQVAGRPFQRSRILAPSVEKQAAVI